MADNNKIAVILTAIDKMSAVVDSAVNKSQAKLNQLSDNAMKMGRTLAATGLSVGAPLYGAIKEAMAFEDKMIDIRKQMENGNSEVEIKKMTDQVRLLSKELPLATAEIQDMIASGLRMGIAEDKIVGYTRNVTKIAKAFDMDPGVIADSMGKIAGVYKIPIDEIGSFADAINYLDDNARAKGPEIIEVLMRIGGTSKYFKPEQAAALATTMVSLGESAETAGTSISAMMNRLGAASMGSKKLQTGLSILGINAADLQKKMNNPATAQGALLDVLERINKIDPSKQNEVLVRLFGLEHAPKIAKLANGIEEYRRQLGLVQGKQKGSIDAEYQKRLEAASSKWVIFKNALRDTSIVTGTTLLPSFNKLLDQLGRILERVSNFATNNPKVISSIGKIAAAFAGVSLAGAGLSFAIGGVAKAMSIGIGVFSGVVKAVKFLTTTWQALQLMISFGGGPIIWAVMAIAGVAFVLIKYWKPIKAFFVELWNGIKEKFTAFVNFGKNLFLNFTPVGLIIKHWDKIKPFFTAIWEFVKSVFNLGITAIKFILLRFTPAGLIYKNWDKIKSFFSNVWDGVKVAVNIGVAAAKAIFLNFTPAGLIYKHWDAIVGFFKRIADKIKGFASSFFEAGKLIIDSIIKGITSRITAITDKVKEVTQRIRDHFPFSPAKAGPLKDIHKIKIIETVAEGIKPAALVNKIRSVAEVAIKPIKAMAAVAVQPLTPNMQMQPIKPVNNMQGQQKRSESGATIQPVFNITVNGVQDKSQVIKVTDEMKRQFNRWMKEYESQKMRVSF